MTKKLQLGIDIDLVCVDLHTELFYQLLTNTYSVFGSYNGGIDIVDKKSMLDDAIRNQIHYWFVEYLVDSDTNEPVDEIDAIRKKQNKDRQVECIMNYYRREDLYDNAIPIPESVKVLKELHETGEVDIIFVTAVKGNHHKSKFNFIKRNYDFDFSFVATQEKHKVKLDVMYDDRAENLVKFDTDGDTLLVLRPTEYRQYVDATQHQNFVGNYNWEEFNSFVKQLLVTRRNSKG